MSLQLLNQFWHSLEECGRKRCSECDCLSAQLSRHITRVKHRGFGFEKKKRRHAYVFSIISMCRVSSVRNSQDNSAMLNHPKASPFSIILALVKLEKKKKKKKGKKTTKKRKGGGGGGGGEKKSFCHCQ